MNVEINIEWELPRDYRGYEFIDVDPKKLKPEPWNVEHMERLRYRFRHGGTIQPPILDIGMNEVYMVSGDHCVAVAIEEGLPVICAAVKSENKDEIIRLLNET